MASIRKTGKQLPAGGVHGLRPGGPPPQAPAKDRPPTRGPDSQSQGKSGWKRKPPSSNGSAKTSRCLWTSPSLWRSTPPTGWDTSPPASWRNPLWPGTNRTSTGSLPTLGSYKLTDLKPEHFRNLYATLRKQKNSVTGKLLSESTVEGVHACLCGILSDAMEGGFLSQNPAWRTYKYAGKKKKKRNIADEETTRKLIAALEEESIKYETYFKLIIATGMRRGGSVAG